MFSRIGCWAYGGLAVLLHDSSSCWEATVDCDFLHHFGMISCVKPRYFRSAFRFAFLHSGFHSCPTHTANFCTFATSAPAIVKPYSNCGLEELCCVAKVQKFAVPAKCIYISGYFTYLSHFSQRSEG